MKKLKSSGFCYDKNNGIHKTLNELDQGIQERLQLVGDAVKTDILNLQNSKKHEIQYVNPYGSLRNLDGRYYDGKK